MLAGAILLLGTGAIMLRASPSFAGALTGDTINGSLQFCTLGSGGNQFTSPSGTAPVVFDWTDGANIDTAAFSDSQLTVQNQVLDVACGWGMTFQDLNAPFATLELVSSDFSGLTFDLTDGIISLSWTGSSEQQTFTAVFNVEVAEPSSLLMTGAGLLGVTLIRRRRQERRTER